MASQSKNKDQQEQNYTDVEKEHKAAQQADTQNIDSGGDNTPDIESMIDFLHGDVTEAESTDGIDMIDEWVDFLKGHKEDNIKELSASLKELKKLLKGKKTEPNEIAAVLAKLGEQTNAIGDEAERGVKGPAHKLGKALISSSHKIEKVAEKADKGSETK